MSEDKSKFRQLMQQAQQLIKSGKYDEARSILERIDAVIDNPTVKKWLAKLDQIAPKYVFDDLEFPEVSKSKPQKRHGIAWWVAVLLFGSCGLIIVLAFIAQGLGITPSPEERNATQTVAASTQIAAQSFATMTATLFTPTMTISPSATPTITDTVPPSATATITNTVRPTDIPTITPSPTITNTAIPTNTLAPTATASLDQIVNEITTHVVVGDVLDITISEFVPSLNIEYEMAETFSGYDVDFTEHEMARLTCALRESGRFDGWRYGLNAMIGLIDAFGNESTGYGVSAFLLPEQVQAINCADPYVVRLSVIAESWDVHRLLRNQ